MQAGLFTGLRPRSRGWRRRVAMTLGHIRRQRNGRWVQVDGDAVLPCGQSASKGRIPGALRGHALARWGSKGVSRQEGSQTLKAEQR
jgi:hypothetical protein